VLFPTLGRPTKATTGFGMKLFQLWLLWGWAGDGGLEGRSAEHHLYRSR
jgi:hypothetical protein